MSLHSIFIFLQSGETLVSHTSPLVKLDHTLLTGLLTAIREFGHEAIDEEIRSIGAGTYLFHYDVLDPLITVGLADSNADELEVQAVLHSLNVLFFNQFETLLGRWRGDVKPFQSFLTVIKAALRAHNERSKIAKARMSSTEYLLATLGTILDVVLLNLLVGGAIIVCGADDTIEQIAYALDQILPFNIPNMHGITDIETAQSILDSRELQRRKHPTLLGVTEEVYRGLTTPINLDHYLFVNLATDPPAFLAPINQPNMDLADQALELGFDSPLQAKLLELQLETLRAQLSSFMKFRQSNNDFTLEDLRRLLHFESERFRLLTYLSKESILVAPPEPEEAIEEVTAPEVTDTEGELSEEPSISELESEEKPKKKRGRAK